MVRHEGFHLGAMRNGLHSAVTQGRKRRSCIGVERRCEGVATIPQPFGEKRTIEGVTRTGGIDSVDRERTDQFAPTGDGDHGAAFAKRESDDLWAQRQVIVADIFRGLLAGKLLRIIKAGQANIGLRDSGMDGRAGPIERPEAQAEIGVIADDVASRARLRNRLEDEVAGLGRDRLADARDVENLCRSDQAIRQIDGTGQARR